MRNVKRKLIGGALSIGCALLAAGGFVIVGENNKGAVPVSLGYEQEPPVIVLDAGHGECSKT